MRCRTERYREIESTLAVNPKIDSLTIEHVDTEYGLHEDVGELMLERIDGHKLISEAILAKPLSELTSMRYWSSWIELGERT
jgi:hypothetical protein